MDRQVDDMIAIPRCALHASRGKNMTLLQALPNSGDRFMKTINHSLMLTSTVLTLINLVQLLQTIAFFLLKCILVRFLLTASLCDTVGLAWFEV